MEEAVAVPVAATVTVNVVVALVEAVVEPLVVPVATRQLTTVFSHEPGTFIKLNIGPVSARRR